MSPFVAAEPKGSSLAQQSYVLYETMRGLTVRGATAWRDRAKSLKAGLEQDRQRKMNDVPIMRGYDG